MCLVFEWNEAKASANARKHGIGFTEVPEAFRDPWRCERLDHGDHGEDRFIMIASLRGTPLFVVYRSRRCHPPHISPGSNTP
ncbi:BrnT family toxin [Luteibacter yeojuensis]|uniref:BrnT family toxin n=1 Tax=Luteibacter yeojuensis TaxID=345309 RepID=UPI0009FE6D43|nr:BrnT family toxin [Luteibacter yeojuensis]